MIVGGLLAGRGRRGTVVTESNTQECQSSPHLSITSHKDVHRKSPPRFLSHFAKSHKHLRPTPERTHGSTSGWKRVLTFICSDRQPGPESASQRSLRESPPKVSLACELWERIEIQWS